MKKQKGTIHKAVAKGLELGLISNSDKKSMKPSGTTYVNALNMCLGWSKSKIIFWISKFLVKNDSIEGTQNYLIEIKDVNLLFKIDFRTFVEMLSKEILNSIQLSWMNESNHIYE